MRFYTTPHTLYCGLDFHVDWMDCGGSAADGEVRVHHNIRPDPQAFLHTLHPVREEVVVCVEGLCTGYWRAALCEAAGIPCVLGHALSMRAIHGGTANNARIDAHQLAALRRGGLMPHADVYPRRRRATRDLLRRRNHRLHKRAAW